MIPETRRGAELNAIVAERVFGYVLANAPCGDGLTRTDQFEAATMAQADADIRAAYAKQVARGMKLWPARYIGPEYSTDIAAAWLVVEKMRADGWGFSLRDFGYWQADFNLWRDKQMHEGGALEESPALAICVAALAALASLPVSGETRDA